MKKEILLTYTNLNEFKQILYFHYLEIFPEEERKPIELIESSYNKGYTKILEILHNNIIVGFMIINRIYDDGFLVLDYFAILPEYQDKGFGTQALKLLVELENKNKGIFIEIEKVEPNKFDQENILKKRRQKFYENSGFKKLGFDLLLFDVIYMPYVFSNIDIEEQIIINEIFNIYSSISGRERIEQNCKIL